MFSFESLASTLEPHPSLALLLLEVGQGPQRLGQARAVLAQLGVGESQIECISPEEPFLLLIRVRPELGHQVVLAFIENGFTRLKIIYPARPQAAQDQAGRFGG